MKKKAISYYTLLLFCYGTLGAQNLVSNHDFSNLRGNCNEATFPSDAHYLSSWFGTSSINNIPVGRSGHMYDFIHQCRKNASGNRLWKLQSPLSSIVTIDPFLCDTFMTDSYPKPFAGDGYVYIGLADTFAVNFKISPYTANCSQNRSTYKDTVKNGRKSYLQTTLKEELKEGVKYYVEFHSYPYYRNTWGEFAISTLGLHISSDTFKVKEIYDRNFNPTFETQSVLDEEKWYKHSFTYKASGNEEFLSIGNFNTASSTNVFFQGCKEPCVGDYSGMFAFPPTYYIDGVYLFKPKDSLFNAFMDSPLYICPGESVTLTVRDTGFKLSQATKNYAWNTGDSSRRIVVDSPGVYTAKVIYDNRWWDTARVVVKEYKPYRSGLPDTVEGCLERQTVVSANTPREYHSLRWSNSSGSANLPVQNEGTYWLTAKWPCDEVTDTVFVALDSCGTVYQKPEFYVPDAFTPNGDGLNDTWDIYKLPKQNEVWVFNRWGERVFHAKNYRGNWDGTDTRGNKLPPGVYAYRIQYTYPPNITDEKKGSLTIMRRKR